MGGFGRVFTAADGTGLHPASASAWFKQLARVAGMPPIWLHDLRHGASKLLGYSDTTTSRDIYISEFHPLKRQVVVQAAAVLMAGTVPWTGPEGGPAETDGSPRSVAAAGRGGDGRRTAVLSDEPSSEN